MLPTRIPAGTLCIVVRDAKPASLTGAIVEVVGHIDRPATADLIGDHAIEARDGSRYLTWRANLQPIGSAPVMVRRPVASAMLEAA